MSCTSCNEAKSMADTIKQACQQLVNGHAGVAALYDSLAMQSRGEIAKLFKEAADKHRKLAHETANDITIPDDGDVGKASAA